MITNKEFVERIAKAGMVKKEDIEDSCNLFVFLAKLTESGYCLSIVCGEEGDTIVFKNLKNNNKLKLREILLIIAGVPIEEIEKETNSSLLS